MIRFFIVLPLLLLPVMANPSGVDMFSDGRGAACERGRPSFCRPGDSAQSIPKVPGPPLLAGLLAFYSRARSLRARILASQNASF
jgi:hypothetical protein